VTIFCYSLFLFNMRLSQESFILCFKKLNSNFPIFFLGIYVRKMSHNSVPTLYQTAIIHYILFIHKILYSFTCFKPQVLIFRRIQLHTCSIWYCHSLREFVVACWCTAVYQQATTKCDSTICCMCTTVSS